ncbi:unnamed protein product [Camellia sinensis]
MVEVNSIKIVALQHSNRRDKDVFRFKCISSDSATKTITVLPESTPKTDNGSTGGGGSFGGDGRFPSGGGGGDGEENDEDEEEFGQVMKYEEAMREIELRGASLPSDMLEAAKTMGLRRLVLTRYLDLQGSVWPLSFLVRYCGMLRNRMLADPNFLFKVGTEVAIDSGCTTFAEFQKRGKDFCAEFELYTADLLVGMVVDIALVSMLAPYTRIGKPSTSSGFFGRFNRACGALPSSVFEAERPGCKFSMKQRIATYFYKLGFGCGLIGQGIANLIMTAKRCESAALENIVKARTALSTSLATTGSVKANMLMLKNLKGLKATDYKVLKDCLGHVEESVDKLSQSVRELKFLGQVQGDKFFPHQSHVQTWTSTALTELNDCEEGLSGKDLGGKIKDSIRGQITNAKKQISNALATINQLAQ